MDADLLHAALAATPDEPLLGAWRFDDPPGAIAIVTPTTLRLCIGHHVEEHARARLKLQFTRELTQTTVIVDGGLTLIARRPDQIERFLALVTTTVTA